MLLGFLVFRNLDLKEMWSALVVSARTTSSLFLIIAAATVVSYLLALSGINYAGVRAGSRVQTVLTIVKVAAIVVLVAAGLAVAADAPPPGGSAREGAGGPPVPPAARPGWTPWWRCGRASEQKLLSDRNSYLGISNPGICVYR